MVDVSMKGMGWSILNYPLVVKLVVMRIRSEVSRCRSRSQDAVRSLTLGS